MHLPDCYLVRLKCGEGVEYLEEDGRKFILRTWRSGTRLERRSGVLIPLLRDYNSIRATPDFCFARIPVAAAVV